jgi:CRISPR/Cas system-associated exonuclease Cas4 (RecB family)
MELLNVSEKMDFSRRDVMKSLINALHSIMQEYPYQQKVMIVDQYSIGEQIMEAYVKSGYAAINLTYKTAMDLAKEVLETHFPNSPQIIDSTIGSQLTYLVLSQLKYRGLLHYFDQMEVTASFSRTMFQTIDTLRMAGYTSQTLNPAMFLTEKKGQDLKQILSNYEELLQKHQLSDQAELIRKALLYADIHSKDIHLLQSNLSLSYLEEELLHKLLPETTVKLPLQPVNGIKIPERTGVCSILWGEPVPFSNVYNLENAKEPAPLSIFTAKTEELEIKTIFQKIKDSQSQFDENIIYYTSGDPYITSFYHLSQKGDIPITFGEGIPVSFSRPGRLAAGILQWIKSNYSVTAFLDLLHQGVLTLEGGAPSNTRITRMLRDAHIGWGKDRYVTQLNDHYKALLEKAGKQEDDERKAYYENRASQVSWVMNMFKTLTAKLPNNEEMMNHQAALNGLLYMIKNACKTTSALDELAKTALIDEIEKVLPYSNETYPRFSVFDKLEDLLLSMRVLRSKPKPGHLHVSSYQNGIYQSRPYVFIIGLDNKKFPGGSSEDPLLLDMERKKLGNRLPIMQDRGQEKLYSMLQLLAQSQGKVTVSYCHFDVNDNRAVSPSYLFLQCYRLVSGNHDADFNDIKQLPSTLALEDAFDERDYWNQYLVNNDQILVNRDLYEHFSNLERGLQAEKKRIQESFSEFDGLVFVDQAALDPIRNDEKVMTASRLETLAACPFSYFLEEVLGVKPVEEIKFDPYKWLDPATRGSLLHKTFETFYQELQKEGSTKPNENHEELIIGIALELINQQKEILPPPNDRVFQLEVNDILSCCRIFLKEEIVHCQTYKPTYFEYTFGAGENKPAEITLSSGKTIKVSGKIDRVDETSSGKYHIIDYKTGSTYNYGTNKIFKGGRQLQHLLYALAIEQHLQLEAGIVEESAYYFPTAKGLGERYVRTQDTTVRTNGLDILERLMDVLANGTFTMTDDPEDCKFCEFKMVCRRSFYHEDTLKVKVMDKNVEALRRFIGVRAYD